MIIAGFQAMGLRLPILRGFVNRLNVSEHGAIGKLVSYSSIGVLNTLSDFLVYFLLTSGLGCNAITSNIFSYTMGIVLSFAMNRKFTFRSSSYVFTFPRQFSRFCTVNLISLAISTAVVAFLSRLITPLLAKMLSVPFVVVWGFIASRTFVFISTAPRDANKPISF